MEMLPTSEIEATSYPYQAEESLPPSAGSCLYVCKLTHQGMGSLTLYSTISSPVLLFLIAFLGVNKHADSELLVPSPAENSSQSSDPGLSLTLDTSTDATET